jgi:pSer/pThr/pTyr-binding forkhead associated (FHA) protein
MSTSWRWQLRLFRGDDAPCDLVVDGGATITGGRGAVNDVALDDATASSQHAALRVADGRVEACDRGSRFGTFVGSAPAGAAWTPVPPGEVVWIGETAIEVVAAALAERSAAGGEGSAGDDDATVMLDAPPTSRRGCGGEAAAGSAVAASRSDRAARHGAAPDASARSGARGLLPAAGLDPNRAAQPHAEPLPAAEPEPSPALLRVDDGARTASFFVAGGASDTLDARALSAFPGLRDLAPIVVLRERGAVAGLHDARGHAARFVDGVLLLGGATFSVAEGDDSLASVAAPRLSGPHADGGAPRAADGGSADAQPGVLVSPRQGDGTHGDHPVPGAAASLAEHARAPAPPPLRSPGRGAAALGAGVAATDRTAALARLSQGRVAAAVVIAVGLGGAAFAAWTLVSVVFAG